MTSKERGEFARVIREASRDRDIRSFITDEGPVDFDLALWERLGSEIGLRGLIVPESLDGVGAGFVELAIVMGELGGTLAVTPALSSWGIATPILLAMPPTRERDDLLARIATTSTITAVGWPDDPSTAGAARPLVLQQTDGGWVVSGTVEFVLDGMIAEVLLCSADDEYGRTLIAIDTDSFGVGRTPMRTLDLTRGMARIALEEVSASRIGVLASPSASEQGNLSAFGAGGDLALVGVSAELVGLSQRCLDEAVGWARQRTQFGRPIGSFQSIKHLLVEMLQQVELARSAVDVAARDADQYLQAPDPASARSLRISASMAKAMSSEAASSVADGSLHVLGGIGFTWEHDAHLYLRRAKSLEYFLGGPDTHRARLARELGVAAS